jgi:hypothetical protein
LYSAATGIGGTRRMPRSNVAALYKTYAAPSAPAAAGGSGGSARHHLASSHAAPSYQAV